jgi:aerobic-type carbon monoxide dehydrogenase small subunit (CoxS/CutS family)
VSLTVDGRAVEVPAAGSLLGALRDHLGVRAAVKDGCSPQGQCGCCTVLVDGAPRVACVTPVRRVAGRAVTTIDGLPEAHRRAWSEAFCATGASQCGFCTPGIICRLEGLVAKRGADAGRAAVDRALAAHLCRCTGWNTIHEAWERAAVELDAAAPAGSPGPTVPRDLEAASRRATIEGRTPQQVDPSVALGRGGFADDAPPAGALVAVPDGRGGWALGETLEEARAAAGKVQGRNTTAAAEPPLELPPGEWVLSLRTGWVEPAYLEVDASWCEPGGEPASPLANGGAFGGKVDSSLPRIARDLADRHGRAVRVLWSREDAVRHGPKRPPIAAGVRADGSGVLRVVRTPGVTAAMAAWAPELVVEEVEVAGPPTSMALRAAGWAEAAVLRAGLHTVDRGTVGPGTACTVRSPEGATASAVVADDGTVAVEVSCGTPLDAVVLRSYCIGAAHMALGWVRSEGLSVAGDGTVGDLTIRSFGIFRAADMPAVQVHIDPSSAEPVNGSDAVFAAVAAAAWVAAGLPPTWPATA